MKTGLYVMCAAAALCGCGKDAMEGQGAAAKGQRAPVKDVRFVTVNPGHFHAALVQNRTYEGVANEVKVFAPEGADLESHLNLIRQFNTRADKPTAWKEIVYRGDDFLAKLSAEKAAPGDVVILAGKNNLKPDYCLAAVKAGFNVLSDKPMAITPEAYAKFTEAADIAEKKGLYFADIMTERNEITTILQRHLVGWKALYGEQEKGTADDPAVTKVSVHHFCKLVNGKPLRRPGWYYDTDQQGEAIVDVTTHLTDLVQWETFPGETLSTADVEMVKARTWPTPISAADYEKSTGLKTWPDFLKKDVDAKNVLQCRANGAFTYRLKGVYANVSVEWHFMPLPGTGDTHYSLMRGTQAEILIRQGPEEGYKPKVYVKPRKGADKAALAQALGAAIAAFNKDYPGCSFMPHGDGWKMVIPQKYEVGHEAHFSQVMNMYLGWMRAGKEPADYIPNMRVKYHTLVEAWKKSR